MVIVSGVNHVAMFLIINYNKCFIETQTIAKYPDGNILQHATATNTKIGI